MHADSNILATKALFIYYPCQYKHMQTNGHIMVTYTSGEATELTKFAVVTIHVIISCMQCCSETCLSKASDVAAELLKLSPACLHSPSFTCICTQSAMQISLYINVRSLTERTLYEYSPSQRQGSNFIKEPFQLFCWCATLTPLRYVMSSRVPCMYYTRKSWLEMGVNFVSFPKMVPQAHPLMHIRLHPLLSFDGWLAHISRHMQLQVRTLLTNNQIIV